MKQHRSCILEKPPEPSSRGRCDCGNIRGLHIIEPVVSSICRPPNPFIMDPQVASKPRVCPPMRKQDFSSLFAMHFQPNPAILCGCHGNIASVWRIFASKLPACMVYFYIYRYVSLDDYCPRNKTIPNELCSRHVKVCVCVCSLVPDNNVFYSIPRDFTKIRLPLKALRHYRSLELFQCCPCLIQICNDAFKVQTASFFLNNFPCRVQIMAHFLWHPLSFSGTKHIWTVLHNKKSVTFNKSKGVYNSWRKPLNPALPFFSMIVVQLEVHQECNVYCE